MWQRQRCTCPGSLGTDMCVGVRKRRGSKWHPRAFSYPVAQLPFWHHLIPHLHLAYAPAMTATPERIHLGLERDTVHRGNTGLQDDDGALTRDQLPLDFSAQMRIADSF